MFADQPEGELYWMVDPDDLDFFSLYDIDATGKGTIGTINHYCLANPGTGVYIPYDIEFDGQVYETEITGWCMVKPNYIPKRRGNYYIAFLFCNGEQRYLDDLLPCVPPLNQLIDENNLGVPCLE